MLVGFGLLKLNMCDAGVTETVKSAWRKPKKQIQAAPTILESKKTDSKSTPAEKGREAEAETEAEVEVETEKEVAQPAAKSAESSNKAPRRHH